ncbi:DoxX family protein [Microlunatus aurantiacus]|uniref:DoxX family protein n=1 Tax=Microlunatus aurantiacus TaxID=446786 RepID=A0ABP7EKR8_9ACTN
MLPEPIWPVVVLAVIQLVDAGLCLEPVGFIAQCLRNVHFAPRFWRWLSPLKLAAALGLLAGLWIPYLGLTTTIALVAYFVVAVSMHVRARDLGRDLFVNATGMLLICLAVLVFSFLR